MILKRPEKPVPGCIQIRFRHPGTLPIERVEVNGKEMRDFSSEYVFLSYPLKKVTRIRVFY